MARKPRKTRLWQFDPSVFQSSRKARFLERRVTDPARSLAKYALYGLAFLYPVILVTLGVIYGGLVFWPSLAGSMLLIWVILKKAGYASNFDSWDIGYRKFLGLIGGFGLVLGFVYGLAYSPLKLMTIPVMGGLLLLGLFLGMWKISNR